MQLVEKHVIKESCEGFKELERITHLSKNLYNAGLYMVRQYFFETGKYLNYSKVCNRMIVEKNVDYYALPTKVSQQVLKMVEKNFSSFFALLRLKNSGNYDKKVNIPHYLDKGGNYVLQYTKQAISTKFLKDGVVKLSGVETTIKTDKKDICQVRIVPKTSAFVIEVVYSIPDVEFMSKNNRFAGCDLGIENLATIGSNVEQGIIIKGTPLKSINQFCNEQVAKERSELMTRQEPRKARGEKISYTTKHIDKLWEKRGNLISDYMHKASSLIVDYLTKNQISVLVIGRTKGWKQEVNIGKMNNQNFCLIPHYKFLLMIKYKAEKLGIQVLEQEESYTSKCSFLDNESCCEKETYAGKRIIRGLFKTASGLVVNADWNAAMNILKKAIGEFNYTKSALLSPRVVNIR